MPSQRFRRPNRNPLKSPSPCRLEKRFGPALCVRETSCLARTARAVASAVIYGMETWGDIFSPRQLLALTSLVSLIQSAAKKIAQESDKELALAVETLLACVLDREAEHSTSLCRWNSSGQKIQATFGRQAIPMLWDYAETNPFGGSVGSWTNVLECVMGIFDTAAGIPSAGHVELASAISHPLPRFKTFASIFNEVSAPHQFIPFKRPQTFRNNGDCR